MHNILHVLQSVLESQNMVLALKPKEKDKYFISYYQWAMPINGVNAATKECYI